MRQLSICIPTYNRLDMLKGLVNSIPEDYLVCISDNGNNVPDDCFNRQNVIVDHIHSVITAVNNWNNVINLTDKDWFILPGDDDIIMPDKLPIVENYIQKYSDCGLIIFGHGIINNKNEVRFGWSPKEEKYLKPPYSFYSLMRNIPCRWPSIVINAEKSRSVGNLAATSGFLCTAVDSLYLQHMAIKYPIALVPIVIGQYRIWDDNGTSQSIFTCDWFKDINLWQDILKDLLIKEKIYEVDYGKMRNQVIYDNLMAALSFARNRSIKEKINFVRNVGWPKGLGLLENLRLIKSITCK